MLRFLRNSAPLLRVPTHKQRLKAPFHRARSFNVSRATLMISQIDQTTSTPLSVRQHLPLRGSFKLRWPTHSAGVARPEHRIGRVERTLSPAVSTLSLASDASEKQKRIGSIDAVRGTAMIFVCLAHFTGIYLWSAGARGLASYLGTVGMIASPTFVAVSGMMVGFFAATNPAAFRELRFKLLDRGVFLLLVGHLLLAITVTRSLAGFGATYRSSFITDAIAVSIMVAPWLMSELKAAPRLAVAASVLLLNCVAVVQWHPTAVALVTVKRYLIGIPSGSAAEEFLVFPVIPWFAAYLAATVLGQLVGRMYAGGDRKGAHQLLARIGFVSFLLAGLLDWATDALRRAHVGPDWNPTFLFALYQKFPPGPVYLGFFGGAGIMLLAAILEIDRLGALPRVMDKLRQVGRASLFTFVAQYALYVTFMGRLHLPYTPLWPLLFLFSLVILARGAATWDRYNGNRFLTVGLSFILRGKLQRTRSGAGRNDGNLFASEPGHS